MNYPYESQYAGAGQGIGQLIAAIFAKRAMDRRNNVPLGTALGYDAVPAAGPGPVMPSPNPMPPMPGGPNPMSVFNPPAGPANPLSVTPSPMVMGAGNVPDVMTYPGAPAAMQPIMSRTVGQMKNLKDALGEPTMRDIFGTMGLSRTPGSVLEWDEATGSFKIKEGAKSVRSQDANVIVRQSELKNKANLQQWRDAVEARLAKGQLAREEALALRADSDMLGFILSPDFEMLEDGPLKSGLMAQATSAVNRLGQRGIKVYTGERARGSKDSPKPAPGQPKPKETPSSGPQETVTARRMRRYNEIKTANPTLTDDQIAAQIAVEEQ